MHDQKLPETKEQWETAYYKLESAYTNIMLRHQGVLNFLIELWNERSTRIFKPKTIAVIITLLIEKERGN